MAVPTAAPIGLHSLPARMLRPTLTRHDLWAVERHLLGVGPAAPWRTSSPSGGSVHTMFRGVGADS